MGLDDGALESHAGVAMQCREVAGRHSAIDRPPTDAEHVRNLVHGQQATPSVAVRYP
jgi:hypothetical protein